MNVDVNELANVGEINLTKKTHNLINLTSLTNMTANLQTKAKTLRMLNSFQKTMKDKLTIICTSTTKDNTTTIIMTSDNINNIIITPDPRLQTPDHSLHLPQILRIMKLTTMNKIKPFVQLGTHNSLNTKTT